MSLTIPLEVRVSVDVGCYQHRVAIGLSSGEVLEEFDIPHQPEGFDDFFARIEHHQAHHACPVAVAMEGFHGYARPLDQLIRARNRGQSKIVGSVRECEDAEVGVIPRVRPNPIRGKRRP